MDLSLHGFRVTGEPYSVALSPPLGFALDPQPEVHPPTPSTARPTPPRTCFLMNVLAMNPAEAGGGAGDTRGGCL